MSLVGVISQALLDTGAAGFYASAVLLDRIWSGKQKKEVWKTEMSLVTSMREDELAMIEIS